MENNFIISGFIFGTVFLIFGLLKFIKRKKYETSGIKVGAVILDLKLEYKNGIKGYFPVVRFTTVEGIEIVEKYSDGIYPSIFSKSEIVDVIYMQNDPKEFIISSFKYIYIEALFLILGLGGIIFSIVKLLFF